MDNRKDFFRLTESFTFLKVQLTDNFCVSCRNTVIFLLLHTIACILNVRAVLIEIALGDALLGFAGWRFGGGKLVAVGRLGVFLDRVVAEQTRAAAHI